MRNRKSPLEAATPSKLQAARQTVRKYRGGQFLSRTANGGVAVPEFLHQASDDQVALAICFGAVVASGLVMHFSHYVGRLTGRIRLHETSGGAGEMILQPQSAHAPYAEETSTRERAA